MEPIVTHEFVVTNLSLYAVFIKYCDFMSANKLTILLHCYFLILPCLIHILSSILLVKNGLKSQNFPKKDCLKC